MVSLTSLAIFITYLSSMFRTQFPCRHEAPAAVAVAAAARAAAAVATTTTTTTAEVLDVVAVQSRRRSCRRERTWSTATTDKTAPATRIRSGKCSSGESSSTRTSSGTRGTGSLTTRRTSSSGGGGSVLSARARQISGKPARYLTPLRPTKTRIG